MHLFLPLRSLWVCCGIGFCSPEPLVEKVGAAHREVNTSSSAGNPPCAGLCAHDVSLTLGVGLLGHRRACCPPERWTQTAAGVAVLTHIPQQCVRAALPRGLPVSAQEGQCQSGPRGGWGCLRCSVSSRREHLFLCSLAPGASLFLSSSLAHAFP